MTCYPLLVEQAESLTETVFSMEEPWRSRFLNVIATQATRRIWDERSPTQEEVVTWLSNTTLYKTVEDLLNVWQGVRL